MLREAPPLAASFSVLVASLPRPPPFRHQRRSFSNLRDVKDQPWILLFKFDVLGRRVNELMVLWAPGRIASHRTNCIGFCFFSIRGFRGSSQFYTFEHGLNFRKPHLRYAALHPDRYDHPAKNAYHARSKVRILDEH